MPPTGNGQPTILITNDDGIQAPGIIALYRAMKPLGNTFIAAPAVEKSGAGHAITISDPLKVTPVKREDDFSGFAITGTPADCVKLAIGGLMERPPDLVVSGINFGDNSATNAIYSGTVAGAREGAMMGVPSVAFSLASFRHGDFSVCEKVATKTAQMVLKNGLPADTLLNVNIPPLPESEVRGFKTTYMGKSRFDDFFEERFNPQKQPYFWLQGRKNNLDEDPESDDLSVKNGYVAITPLRIDQTNESFLENLRQWDWKF